MNHCASMRAAAALLALAVAGCSAEPPRFLGTDITGTDWGRELALTGHDGKPRTLADFRGKIVVLTFGFVNCPDVCPTTLSDAASAMRALGSDAGRVQVLFMTVDPERDSLQMLDRYVPAFDPTFLGLRGDAEATQKAAKEFKIFYARRAEGAAYVVDHSAQAYVFDAQGRLRLMVKHERIAADLPQDIRQLLKERSS